jgi:hypothetical protein
MQYYLRDDVIIEAQLILGLAAWPARARLDPLPDETRFPPLRGPRTAFRAAHEASCREALQAVRELPTQSTERFRFC